jgi:glycine/D-amino acid oxidase-like deaminating enzyme
LTFDVVIAGGGIVGTACAAEFAASGLKVAIVEPGVIGGGATAAGMGHLTTMHDSEPQFALTRYSQVLWRQLADQLPQDCEYRSCGAIWVAADEEEMAEVQRKYRFYSERNVPVKVLDERALADAEPNLRKGLAGGLMVTEDSVVYPPCAAKFLATQAHSIFSRRRVAAFRDDGVTLDDGSVLSAGFVVLATGADAAQLVPGVAVKARKGHLLITDRHPGFLHSQLIELGYLKSAHSSDEDSVAFNVQPRATGQILIGSSRQFGAHDSAIESHMMNAMLRRALEYMPGLGNLSAIRGWTGFRAATPDKLPLVGPCPGYARVYLATGHEGLGISTSLATARLLADQILDRESAIPREPYLPERNFAPHVVL